MNTVIKKRDGHETLIHEVKSDYQYFIEVLRGDKQSEVRYNDRDYQDGDFMFIRQTQYSHREMGQGGKPLVYTGRELMLKITHVHENVGLMHNFVVISFKVLDRD